MSRYSCIRNTDQWKDRALVRARSLQGRDHTPDEKAFIEQSKIEDGDEWRWEYFRVFGVQPETQAYIDATIQQLEKCSDLAQRATCEIRLEWSCRALLKGERMS